MILMLILMVMRHPRPNEGVPRTARELLGLEIVWIEPLGIGLAGDGRRVPHLRSDENVGRRRPMDWRDRNQV